MQFFSLFYSQLRRKHPPTHTYPFYPPLFSPTPSKCFSSRMRVINPFQPLVARSIFFLPPIPPPCFFVIPLWDQRPVQSVIDTNVVIPSLTGVYQPGNSSCLIDWAHPGPCGEQRGEADIRLPSGGQRQHLYFLHRSLWAAGVEQEVVVGEDRSGEPLLAVNLSVAGAHCALCNDWNQSMKP